MKNTTPDDSQLWRALRISASFSDFYDASPIVGTSILIFWCIFLVSLKVKDEEEESRWEQKKNGNEQVLIYEILLSKIPESTHTNGLKFGSATLLHTLAHTSADHIVLLCLYAYLCVLELICAFTELVKTRRKYIRKKRVSLFLSFSLINDKDFFNAIDVDTIESFSLYGYVEHFFSFSF